MHDDGKNNRVKDGKDGERDAREDSTPKGSKAQVARVKITYEELV